MKNLLLFILVALLGLGLACSEAPVAPNDDSGPQFTEVEMPVSWLDLFTMYGMPEDGSYDGDLVDPNLHPPTISDTSWDVYAVTLIWGGVPFSTSDAATTIDWSGRLSVNGEAVVHPVKTIDFEPGEDSLVLLNIPSQAGWVSVTHSDFDGISFLVFLKRGIIYVTAPVLTIETEPFTHSWDFGRLERLCAYYKVGNDAGLGILAHKINRYYCPRGSLAGYWNRDGDQHDKGFMEGIWYDDNNQPIGLYSGQFWMGDNGLGKFHGWVSGYITDQVIAEFEGVWYYDDLALCPTCGDRHGLFKGRVKWLDSDHVGEMWGAFGDLDMPWDELKRPMVGRWHLKCRDSNRLFP